MPNDCRATLEAKQRELSRHENRNTAPYKRYKAAQTAAGARPQGRAEWQFHNQPEIPTTFTALILLRLVAGWPRRDAFFGRSRATEEAIRAGRLRTRDDDQAIAAYNKFIRDREWVRG